MARSRARKAKARRKAQGKAQREAQRRRKAQWKAQGEAWQKGYNSHNVIGTTQRRNFLARSRARKARRKVYSRDRTLEDKEQKQDALDYAVSGGHFESNRRKH